MIIYGGLISILYWHAHVCTRNLKLKIRNNIYVILSRNYDNLNFLKKSTREYNKLENLKYQNFIHLSIGMHIFREVTITYLLIFPFIFRDRELKYLCSYIFLVILWGKKIPRIWFLIRTMDYYSLSLWLHVAYWSRYFVVGETKVR